MTSNQPSVQDLSSEKQEFNDVRHSEHAGPELRSAFADLPTGRAIRKFWRLFGTGAMCALGATYIGYTGAAVGNVVANEGFIKQFGTVHTPTGLALDAQYVSIWGAIQSVSQIVFQFLSPFVIDRFGRKTAMYILTINVFAAILVEIFATNWKHYTVAKMFSGAASGFLGPAILTWMSEASMPQFRGVLLATFAFFLAIGQFTNAIASQIVNTSTPMKYKHIFYSEFVYLGLWGIPALYLPESPIWLISKNRMDKAKRSLHRLVGNVEGYDLDHEFAVLVAEVRLSEETTRSYSDNDWKALFKWTNFKRCVAASLPFTGQQFAGVPYIYGYTTYFFQLAGVQDPFLGNTILNCIYVASLFASFFFVDKVGRRPLVLVGMAVLAVVNFIIGGLGFAAKTNASGKVLTALCSIWICVYSLTVASVGWTAIVEVSSIRLRAKTAAFGVLMNSFVGLIFTYCVPLMLSDQDAGWGQKIGIFFGGLSALYFIPCYFLYPETKGRPYSEIDELYERNISPRKFKSTVLDAPVEAGVGA